MLINGRHEVFNIDHIRIKGCEGRWSLRVYPKSGDLLMPAGASMTEIDAPREEIERIVSVARHLFPGLPEEFGGEPRRLSPIEMR